MRESQKIFGVEIGRGSRDVIKLKISQALEGEGTFFVATLNPEILLLAENDPAYRDILNSAEVRVVDGAGVKIVSWLRGIPAGDRFAGPELPEYILDQASKRNLRIGLVIRKPCLSTREEIMKTAGKRWGRVEVIKHNFDSPADTIATRDFDGIDVLLVGFGAPLQEQFIAKFMHEKALRNLRLAMGVGGTFDYWTGKQKRAPKFLQKIGLEWSWRLATQPRRLKRIWNATVVFPCKALFQ